MRLNKNGDGVDVETLGAVTQGEALSQAEGISKVKAEQRVGFVSDDPCALGVSMVACVQEFSQMVLATDTGSASATFDKEQCTVTL